jgi:putative FmdB family regulatory protein
MPLYEYRCDECGHVFEELVFHLDDKVNCPKCHGSVHKLMSTFSYDMPDEVCGKLPRGEARELCTECKQGGSACPMAA